MILLVGGDAWVCGKGEEKCNEEDVGAGEIDV